MSEKELLYQIITREVENILGSVNPAFRMFNNVAVNYIVNLIDPYVDAFIANDKEHKIDTKMVGEFLKDEVNTKVDNFMKKFKEEKNKHDDL
jgi:hypothetical protein